jgi:hypothetical protein
MTPVPNELDSVRPEPRLKREKLVGPSNAETDFKRLT